MGSRVPVTRVYSSETSRIGRGILRAFHRGCQAAGCPVQTLPTDGFAGPLDRTRVAVVVGVKSSSIPILSAYRAAGVPTLLFDKGYTQRLGRKLPHWRASPNAFQPYHVFGKLGVPDDRWLALGLTVARQRRPGERVLLAGASQKYHDFHGLGPATDYAVEVVRKVRKRTSREIVYRPKPSWRDKEPVRHTTYSGPDVHFADELKDAWCLLTHGSNACLEATLSGVPAVVLGPGVTAPLGNTSLDRVVDPALPDPDLTYALCRDLAYLQYTEDELTRASTIGFLFDLLDLPTGG